MLTGRKLLLADDSLTIQKVVSLTFNDEEMEVTTVGSGAQAIEKLDESLPDIVLADVFMPEPNGYQLCERIKRGERTRHIPVVLLVGTFEPFNEAEARRVGADEVLTKPFQSIRELVNKVGGLLGGHADEKPTPGGLRDDGDADTPTQDLPPIHRDAHAADAASATGEAASSSPTDAFGDFDMDDATIQSVPAEQFDAYSHATAADAPVFSEVNEEERFSDRAETDEAFVLTDDSPSTPAAASMQAQQTASTASAEKPARTQSAFAAHMASAAEADDALLELGDIAPASRFTSADDDDFILDMGDEELPGFSTGAAPQPSAEEDLSFAGSAQVVEETETVAEPEMFDEPSLLVETASAPVAEEAQAVEATQHQEAETHAYSPAWDVEPVVASMVAHAGGGDVHVEAAHEESQPASVSETQPAPVPHAQATEWSPEMMDEVVRRVVAHMSEQVVRQIAWEVVPDLAERLIKQRLEEEKTRAQ